MTRDLTRFRVVLAGGRVVVSFGPRRDGGRLKALDILRYTPGLAPLADSLFRLPVPADVADPDLDRYVVAALAYGDVAIMTVVTEGADAGRLVDDPEALAAVLSRLRARIPSVASAAERPN